MGVSLSGLRMAAFFLIRRGDIMANPDTFDAMFSGAVSYIRSRSFGEDATASKKLADVLCQSLDKSRNAIEVEYTRINSDTKRDFMEFKEVIRLDRHKCTAAFMIAFLKRLELDPDIIKKLSRSLPVSNLIKEKLVMDIGLVVMATMIKADTCEKNAKIIDFLSRNDDFFKLPEVESDHKPYARNWAMELHFANKKNKLFVLSLSHELFCIEKINRLLADPAA